MLGVLWKKKKAAHKRLREAGWFIRERAGGEDNTVKLEVLFQQTSGTFDEVIKGHFMKINGEGNTERDGVGIISLVGEERTREAP